MRHRGRRGGLFVAIIFGVGLLIALTQVTGSVHWDGTDALFYQAQALEIRGDSPAHARQVVIDGHPGQSELAVDRSLYPAVARQLASPAWRSYSAHFYRRRWLVSALTALVIPVFGERSLLVVSALGYVLCGVLLYALLSRRFTAEMSLVVTLAFLISPPVHRYLLGAGTDSWGIALLLLALLLGVAALERGGLALLGWFSTLAVLSITREDGIVAVVAALWVALRRRDRRATGVAVTGVVAALPAGVLLGVSLGRALAYVENGFNPPPSTSWSFVLHHYPAALKATLVGDLKYMSHAGWLTPSSLGWHLALVVFALGLVALLRRPDGDAYFQLMRGSLLGAIVFILVSVNYTGLRLELVFTPAVAVGLALLAEHVPGVLHRLMSHRSGVCSGNAG